MNGREFGEALERAMDGRIKAGITIDSHVSLAYTLLRNDLRAALASKDAGPQDVPSVKGGVFRNVNIAAAPAKDGSAGGFAMENSTVITVAELSRLRARDRWIEEHAKPALKFYSTWKEYKTAREALAALPQDPQGGVR